MARIEADALENPEPIYLASSLRGARRVEALLTSRGIDYVVQVESLGRTALFGTMRQGAGFYVSSAAAAGCRVLLAAAGLSHGIVDAQAEEEE